MKPGKDLVERFLKNQCTAAEADAIDRVFKENPGALEAYLPVNAWFTGSEKQLNKAVSNRILQQIRSSYEKKKGTPVAVKLLRYIAAASVACLMGWMAVRFVTDIRTPAKDTTAGGHIGAPDVLNTIGNKTGKVMHIVLPDCSVVALYPQGQLQYLPAFEKSSRTLYLKGKAGFAVYKDKTRPFTVYASGIATTALGTKFLISVLENQRVSVILEEGIVKVSPQRGKNAHLHVVLHPGDQLIVNSGEFSRYSLMHQEASVPPVRKRNAQPGPQDSRDTPAKPEGRLVFKNQALKDVFRKIEEKFDVIIADNNAHGIGEKLFTGMFLENDSLEFICDLICRLYDLHYRIEGHTVIIRAN